MCQSMSLEHALHLEYCIFFVMRTQSVSTQGKGSGRALLLGQGERAIFSLGATRAGDLYFGDRASGLSILGAGEAGRSLLWGLGERVVR